MLTENNDLMLQLGYEKLSDEEFNILLEAEKAVYPKSKSRSLQSDFRSFNIMLDQLFDCDSSEQQPDASYDCPTTELDCEVQSTVGSLVEVQEPQSEYSIIRDLQLFIKPEKNFIKVEKEKSDSSLKRRRQDDDVGKLEATNKVKISKVKRANRWTLREDIFLTAVVLQMYYIRHSLKPSKKEKAEAIANGVPVDQIIWGAISRRYLEVCTRFEYLSGQLTPIRTLSALQKRWKVAGKEGDFELPSGTKIPLTKHYQQQWDKHYNLGNVLFCEEKDFQKLIESEFKKEYDVKVCMKSEGLCH